MWVYDVIKTPVPRQCQARLVTETTPRQSDMCLIEECKPEFTGQINKPKRRNALKTVVTKASDETIPKIWNEYFNKHIKK